MGRRFGHFLVTFWWLAWALVIVPCHTRGAISVGGARAAPGTPLFFGTILPSCCASKKEGGQRGPARDPGNCAVCQLVATTPHAPVVLPGCLFLHRQGLLPTAPPRGSAWRLPIRPYHSRAPPFA